MVAVTPSRLNEVLDFVDGKWIKPTVELGAWNCNPNTGEPLQPQMATSPEQVERALQAAYRVHHEGEWTGLSVAERVLLLLRVADELDKRVDEIAYYESLTTGVIISLTQGLARIPALAFRAAAEQLQKGLDSRLPGPYGEVEVLRRPWGPAVLIAPWNAPAPIAAHKVANALAAGCPAILKPSEFAPNSCQLIADAIAAAGLPNGVFQLVHGGPEVGAKLVADRRIRAVSFTGGLRGGRAVAQACALDFKAAQLELGGNNAFIVLEDADLKFTAQGVVAALTTLNGQWCRALGRLLVHESLADTLLEQTLDYLAAVKIGDSTAPDSQMGPLIHAGHLQMVTEQRDELISKGGMAHSSTLMPDLPGYFIQPTLITACDPADTLEEIFGPVAVVHTFKSDDEAVSLANQTPYGLGGNVYSRDEARAMSIARRMETGGVKVNGVGLIGLHPLAPRPAWGLSGFGEEGTFETFRFFLGTRVIGVAGR